MNSSLRPIRSARTILPTQPIDNTIWKIPDISNVVRSEKPSPVYSTDYFS
jgi:hypothetical protein